MEHQKLKQKGQSTVPIEKQSKGHNKEQENKETNLGALLDTVENQGVDDNTL